MHLSIVVILLTAVTVRAADPATVHLIRRAGHLPQAWYVEQARQWQQQLTDHPDDSRGWYSLYVARQYSGPRGRADLSPVLESMARHVPSSWELPYLRARAETDRQRKVAFLKQALARCGHCGEVIEDLALERELTSDRGGADDLWRQLYDSAVLARGLLDYDYNLLHSVTEGAILITNGDNDTYPAWMLQRARGVRPDVLVLNLYLADNLRPHLQKALSLHGVTIDTATLQDLPHDDKPAFLAALVETIEAVAPDTPLYLALTLGADLRQPLAPRLQLTGLAARVGPAGPAELRRNLEQRFRLDSLRQDWYADSHVSTRPIVRRLNGNYSYPMLALARALDPTETEAASRWRRLALRLARDSGDAHLVEHVQSRLGGS